MPTMQLVNGEPKMVPDVTEEDDAPFDLETTLQDIAILTQRARDLEAQFNVLDKKVSEMSADIIEYIRTHSGIKPPFRIEFNGFKATISLNTRTVWGASDEGNWLSVKEALIAVGWDDVVRPQSQALSGRLNEYEDGELEIPAALAAVVKKKEIKTLKVVGIKPVA